jgi:hypothetical protein
MLDLRRGLASTTGGVDWLALPSKTTLELVLKRAEFYLATRNPPTELQQEVTGRRGLHS